MVDREEEERSPFDQWIERASQETQDKAKVEELTRTDPARESETETQLHEIAQDLGTAGVEHHEMTVEERVDLQLGQLKPPDPFKKDFDTVLAEAGQALNQANVSYDSQTQPETQSVDFATSPNRTPNQESQYGKKWQSPFDSWGSQESEQTRPEPEQQQGQEPEQDR